MRRGGEEEVEKEVVGGEKNWVWAKWRPEATRLRVTTAPSQRCERKSLGRTENDANRDLRWKAPLRRGGKYRLCASEKRKVKRRRTKGKRGKSGRHEGLNWRYYGREGGDYEGDTGLVGNITRHHCK